MSLFFFRDIIRNAVNASEYDSVIFVGSGCTAAVHKLIHSLNLSKPPVSQSNCISLLAYFVKNKPLNEPAFAVDFSFLYIDHFVVRDWEWLKCNHINSDFFVISEKYIDYKICCAYETLWSFFSKMLIKLILIVSLLTLKQM